MWSEVTVDGTHLLIFLLGAPVESSGSETKSVSPSTLLSLVFKLNNVCCGCGN